MYKNELVEELESREKMVCGEVSAYTEL